MLLLIFFGINLLNSFNVTKIVDIVVRTCAIKTGLSISDFSHTNIQLIKYFILSLDKSRDRCTTFSKSVENVPVWVSGYNRAGTGMAVGSHLSMLPNNHLC